MSVAISMFQTSPKPLSSILTRHPQKFNDLTLKIFFVINKLGLDKKASSTTKCNFSIHDIETNDC
jgi:hypothetical protein